MMTRSLSKTVAFEVPFVLSCAMIFVPGRAHGASSVEMVPIDPRDLQAALERDAVP
jgi:hypothetical protein